MKQYSFAQNGRKLQRAIMEVGKEELAEEQKYSRVKALYVSYGGSLINEAPQEEPTKEEVVEEKVEEVLQESLKPTTEDVAL